MSFYKITEQESNHKNLEKKSLPKWFETKYVAGGQRDIEFLKFFYEYSFLSFPIP